MSLALIQRKLDKLKEKEQIIKSTYDIRGFNKNQHRYIDDLREDYKNDMVLKASTNNMPDEELSEGDEDDFGGSPGSAINKDEEVNDSERADSPSVQSPSNANLISPSILRPVSSQYQNRPGTASIRPGTAQQRPATAAVKRPGTAQKVMFDDTVQKTITPTSENTAKMFSGRPLSGISRPYSASQAKLTSVVGTKTAPAGFFPPGIRPISAIYTTKAATDGSAYFNPIPENFHPELGQNQSEVIRNNYQDMLKRPKSADTQFWKNTKKYDNVHAKPKTKNYSIRPLLFEFKHNHPHFISSTDLEYLHNEHMITRFNSSKLIAPENHEFMDIIAKMNEAETPREQAVQSEDPDETKLKGITRVKTKENLKFAQKSFMESLGFFAEIRKEAHSQSAQIIRPKTATIEHLHRPENKEKGFKNSRKLRFAQGKLDIQDLVLFRYLKNEEKVKMFRSLGFILTKTSKSKHLQIYNDLERELTEKHDWSKYQQRNNYVFGASLIRLLQNIVLKGNKLHAILIDMTTFDNIFINHLHISKNKLCATFSNESLEFDTIVNEFRDLTKSKVVLALVYATHSHEKDTKHLLLKRFVMTPHDNSFEFDMKLIYRFYLTLLLLNNPDKKVGAGNTQYDTIHHFIEKSVNGNIKNGATNLTSHSSVDNHFHQNNIGFIWREILRLKEETVWLDYRLGVREVVLQEYLKQRYSSLGELFLIKDAKDYKRFENMLSPVNIKPSDNLVLSDVDSLSINKSIQDVKGKMNNFASPRAERPESATINSRARPQSAAGRAKVQSYQKQVSDFREKTQLALTQSASSFKFRPDSPNEPLFMKTFTSDRRGTETIKSANAEDLFVQDDNQITVRYKQPVLVPKNSKPFKPYRTISVQKKNIQPHQNQRKEQLISTLLAGDVVSIKGSNYF